MTKTPDAADASKWTEVRHKKPGRVHNSMAKDPPAKHVTDNVSSIPTTPYRVEFAVTKKTSTFNPVSATAKLYQVLQKACPAIIFYSCDRITKFDTADNFPNISTHFNTHFNVTPHLYPMGGGHIHVHFCLDSTINMDKIQQIPEVYNHRKQNQIWITSHQYDTYKLTKVGIFLHKSSSITYRPQYHTDLMQYLLQYVETTTHNTDTIITTDK